MANEVNITMTAKDLASGKIKGVGDQAKTSMDKLRGMRGSFLAVGAAGGAVIGALGLAIKTFAQTGDEIQKMSFRTAIGTEVLSEYKFALEQSGSSIDGFEKSIKRMSSFVLDGRDGLTTTTDALDRLGISVLDLEGLGVEDAFVLLSSALADVEDDITQAALAQDVFGRAGTALLPLLAQGADGIAALREEAQELGIVFDQDMADSAARVVDAQNTMKKSVLGLQMAFAEHLAPALSSTLEFMGKVISKVTAFAKENPVLTYTIGIMATAVGLLAIGIGALGLVIPLAATAFGALGIGVAGAALSFVGFNLATGGILIAIGLIVAGIIALIMNWDEVVRAVKIGINFMSGAIEVWANFYIKAINKIIDGINKLAGIFGKEIDQIADLEIPRFNTAMEEMAEVTEEETESVNTALETTQDEFVRTADVAEESSEKIAEATESASAKIRDALGLQTRREIQAQKNRQLVADQQAKLREEEAAKEQAVLDEATERLAAAGKEQRRIWQETHDFRMELGEAEVAEQERLLKIEEAASAEIIRIEEEEAAKLVEIEKDKQDKLEAERAQALADTLENAELRMNAVKALREENSAAFARIKAEVDLLPANIQTQTSMGMSREAVENRGGVMRAFKDSQKSMTDALAAARAFLASGEFGGGTTTAMAQAEVDRLVAIVGQKEILKGGEGADRFDVIQAFVEASAGHKGVALGALFAPKGGFGSSAPPMLPGMEFGAAAATTLHTTVVFNGDTYGLDDFTDKVNEGITAAQQRGATMWIDRGEDR